MTGNEGKLGDELSLVDVQVGTADTARLFPSIRCYYQQTTDHIVVVEDHLP